MANSGMSEGFIAHTEKMIADLKAELAPYKAGSMTAGKRQHGGEWHDITTFRIEQIEREIIALENSVNRHKESHA